MDCADHREHHTDQGTPLQWQPSDRPVNLTSDMATDICKTTRRVLDKYAPFFERARQVCFTHWLAQNDAAVINEVKIICDIDEALVGDLCLMTDLSRAQAQGFRQLRRSDLDRLIEAATRSLDAESQALGQRLNTELHQRSLSAIKTLAAKAGTEAPAYADDYDERFRDYGTVVVDLEEIASAQ